MDPPRSSQESASSAPRPSTTTGTRAVALALPPTPPSAPPAHADPSTSAASPLAPPVHTASFVKPMPLPVPHALALPPPPPPAAVMVPNPEQTPSPSHSAPRTPPILQSPPSALIPAPSSPPLAQSQSQMQIAAPAPLAGPSRRPTQSQIQESDEEPEQDRASNRPVSTSSHGNGAGAGGASVPGDAEPTPRAGVRRPGRTVSIHERPVRQTERYPSLSYKHLPTTPTGPHHHQHAASVPAPGGVASNPEAFFSQGSGFDWNVPYVGRVEGAQGAASASAMPIVTPGMPVPRPTTTTAAAARRRSVFSATLNGEKTVGERIMPTLDAAKHEKERAELRAKAHGWALNVAIGAQVVLGALTTGVAAATTGKQTSIATSILGGLATLSASYLAKARGSGEPEGSVRRAQDLSSFIRDCEAFELDHGHKTGTEQDDMIMRYRRRFEEIMGNDVEGVGDDVKVRKKQQQQKEGGNGKEREREKYDSPV